MKSAVITGASRGVGKAIAEALAEDGWRLLLNCRSRFDLLDANCAALSEKTECRAVHGEIDSAVLGSFLGIDLNSGRSVGTDEILLVNNGGISRFNLLQDVSDAEFGELLDSNLGSMFRLSRAMIPYLLKAGQGRIWNISSVWGVTGASMESIYSLTKGGVNALTKALAKELAPNHIPVNALALGCVDTDMNGWMSSEDRAAVEEEIPYGRMATAEEAAEMLRLLIKSPAYLTGQIIQFDGGWI